MMNIQEIAIDKIVTGKLRWKREVKAERVTELSESLREEGLIHPITVRKLKSGYEIIAGEHRRRAAKKLGWKKIAAHVTTLDEPHARILSIHENTRRYQPSSFEWAEGLAAEKEIFEAIHGPPPTRGQPKKASKSIPTPRRNKSFTKEAAENYGVSERHVEKQIAKITKLAPKAKEAWKKKKITSTQADELVKLPPEKQEALLPNLEVTTREETREIVRAEEDEAVFDRLARQLTKANGLAERLNEVLSSVLVSIDKNQIDIGGVGALKIGFELVVLQETLSKLGKVLKKEKAHV